MIQVGFNITLVIHLALVCIGIHIMSSLPVKTLPQIYSAFEIIKDPSFGPGRLGTGFYEKSLTSCAKTCSHSFEMCNSFMYNSTTGLCTPGSSLNETEPLPTKTEGDLYILKFICDGTQGFYPATHETMTSCFGLFFKPKLNYTDSDIACQSMGAHLMSVKTKEKLTMVKSVATDTVWIGCDDMEVEGRFVWKKDGEEVMSKTFDEVFANGKQYSEDEDCVAMNPEFNFSLDDVSCKKERHYACEM